MDLSRRTLITGLTSLLAAPAIVHAGNLMPVRGATITIPDGFPNIRLFIPPDIA